ncbi:MAG: hypothetical protein ACNA8W_17595, partial [Bradymonadaceae bacterium]
MSFPVHSTPSRHLWSWLTLMVGFLLVFSTAGCEPEFTDHICQSDSQCFSFEECVDSRCVPRETVPAEEPVIDLFEVDPVTIEPGETIVLRWRTSHATRLEITSPAGKLTINNLDRVAEGEQAVPTRLFETTTFTLTASNRDGEEVSAEATVEVISTACEPTEAPGIIFFEADQVRVDRGTEIIVSWQAENGCEGSLRAGGESAELTREELDEGSRTVTIEEDEEIRLQISNERGADQRIIEVVLDRPIVESFEVETEDPIAGDPVTVAWQVSNADSVTIVDADGEAIDLGT